jgi:hypothetical protein
MGLVFSAGGMGGGIGGLSHPICIFSVEAAALKSTAEDNVGLDYHEHGHLFDLHFFFFMISMFVFLLTGGTLLHLNELNGPGICTQH